MYSNNAASRVFNRKETIHCNNYKHTMNIIVAIIDYKTPWPCSSGAIF